jgi:hypothetical protein
MGLCPLCGSRVDGPTCGNSLCKGYSKPIVSRPPVTQRAETKALPLRKASKPQEIEPDLTISPFRALQILFFVLAVPIMFGGLGGLVLGTHAFVLNPLGVTWGVGCGLLLGLSLLRLPWSCVALAVGLLSVFVVAYVFLYAQKIPQVPHVIVGSLIAAIIMSVLSRASLSEWPEFVGSANAEPDSTIRAIRRKALASRGEAWFSFFVAGILVAPVVLWRIGNAKRIIERTGRGKEFMNSISVSEAIALTAFVGHAIHIATVIIIEYYPRG